MSNAWKPDVLIQPIYVCSGCGTQVDHFETIDYTGADRVRRVAYLMHPCHHLLEHEPIPVPAVDMALMIPNAVTDPEAPSVEQLTPEEIRKLNTFQLTAEFEASGTVDQGTAPEPEGQADQGE